MAICMLRKYFAIASRRELQAIVRSKGICFESCQKCLLSDVALAGAMASVLQ